MVHELGGVVLGIAIGIVIACSLFSRLETSVQLLDS